MSLNWKYTSRENSPSVLTMQEVSNLLHVHVNTLRRWSDMGIIPAYRIGPRGDRRFKREDIDTFLDEYHRRKID